VARLYEVLEVPVVTLFCGVTLVHLYERVGFVPTSQVVLHKQKEQPLGLAADAMAATVGGWIVSRRSGIALTRGILKGKTGQMEWVPPVPRLEAGDIALRQFEAKDAGAIAESCRDPDILRFTFMKDGLSEAEALEWIDTGNESWPEGHPRFAIVDAKDDHLLGQVGLFFYPRQVSGEAYYWVDESERHRGVAFRALGLVVDWGFSKGIERMFLLVHPENEASNRLAEKLGFTREGVLRGYEPFKGRRPDLVSWSLLPGD
jgi:RimJ/RimL family protein N-acetyltransferase